MGTCTASPNWYTVVDIDGHNGGVHRTAMAAIGLNQSAPESITAPSISTGASSGNAGTNYTYTASAAVSSFGHPVEYQSNWGDGTTSAWLGSPVASHAWSGTTIYTVFVQARCATEHTVVSPPSGGYTVNLTGSTVYTISGQVQQPNGSGIGGTILAARDTQNTLITTVISDTSGNYALSLPAGSYTVTATSPFGAFSPATLSYDLSGHRSGQNRRLLTLNVFPEEPRTGLETQPPVTSLHQQPFTAWFGDANLIKRFNGAPVGFLVWKNNGDFVNNPFWKFDPKNSVSNNIVKEVCSCTGPTRNCLPTLKGLYK
jgi:hypothetical protein